MPQMAPCNWLILFIYFNIIIYLVNCFIYYLYYNMDFFKNYKKNVNYNVYNMYMWKW